MMYPKTALLIARLLANHEEEDNNALITAVFVPFLIIIVILVLTVYILITPLSIFAQVLYPEEATTVEQFQEDYAYILKDIEEFNYVPPSTSEGGAGNGGNNGTVPNDALELLDSLAIPENKRALIQNALSLVGKVDYFWGGKSKAGWNENWGEPRQVTAAGSKNTGKVMPYGLDCSGFVDWVYKTTGLGTSLSGGTAYQWGNSYAIKESELIPGDLVFKNPPGNKGVNHVGIYLGENDSSTNLYVHCSGGEGVVVNSWSGFEYYRRPML